MNHSYDGETGLDPCLTSKFQGRDELTFLFLYICLVIDPCLEPFSVNGSSVLRDSGVCGTHGTCESLSAGTYRCKCDRDYMGNHCHISKYALCLFQ